MCQLLAYFGNPVQPFSLGYSWKYFWYRQNKNLDLKIISGKEKNSFFGYHSTKWRELIPHDFWNVLSKLGKVHEWG